MQSSHAWSPVIALGDLLNLTEVLGTTAIKIFIRVTLTCLDLHTEGHKGYFLLNYLTTGGEKKNTFQKLSTGKYDLGNLRAIS